MADWRDHFLSTGIPLEEAVRTHLQDLGISAPGEYSYERPDENGEQKLFSVDVLATKTYTNFELKCLIECKYKKGARWIFSPERNRPSHKTIFSNVFLPSDTFNPTYRMSEPTRTISLQTPVSSRASAIGKGDDQMIRRATQQLRFGTAALRLESIMEIVSPFADEYPLEIIVPIVVTNSELHLFRSEATLEDVESASHFGEICERKELLLYRVPVDAPLRAFYSHQIDRLDDSWELKHLETIGDMKHLGMYDNLRSMIYATLSRSPCYFYVMTYESFKSNMTKLLNYFDNRDIIECKSRE